MFADFGESLKKASLRKAKRYWPTFYGRAKNLIPYAKPALTSADIIKKVQSAGLQVHDVPKAIELLNNVNYYRFKAYLRPYLSPTDGHLFSPGAIFEEAVELHEFDRELRNFILGLTSQIEILLRHRIDARITNFSDDPFWYIDPKWYRDYPKRTLSMIRGNSLQTREDFTRHFHAKYHSGKGGRYHLLPPFWMASELLTMGQLHYLVNSLNKEVFNQGVSGMTNELDRLAIDFGAYNIQSFVKWMEFIRNIRNYCAHQNRVWNRHLAEPAGAARALEKKKDGASVTRHRLYHHLVMMRIMLRERKVPDLIAAEMTKLFAKYPAAAARNSQMGFPGQWQDDPFWHGP